MKIVQINSTCGAGSTGKICVSVSDLLSREGIENYVLYTLENSSHPKAIKYSTDLYAKSQALRSRILGNNGFNSKRATAKLIKLLEDIEPDGVHIHNIHSHDCDLRVLFEYLRKKKIKIWWTFHDCWSFTAYCHYFTLSGCDKWQSGCRECPRRKEYSWFADRSERIYSLKKELSEGLDLTIVTPSQWLCDLVKKSFFADYPVKVINNGIDLSVFKPTESDIGNVLGVGDKKLLLGVAFGWDRRKGIDVFVELARRLDDSYAIVLVGTDEKVEKLLPKNIIAIRRTKNQEELAKLYTAADLFVNPTREENYPTVNMEAIACGTPVLTFRTGGSTEIIGELTGASVPADDLDALEREIIRICETKPYSKENCVKQAEGFDMALRFREYVEMYKESLEK